MSDVASIMQQMATNFDGSKVGDLDATVGFDLSGEDGGKWTANIANGECTVNDGIEGEVTATINMDAGDFADMTSGKLNPMAAFMTGKVKVDGDLGTVMKLQNLFG